MARDRLWELQESNNPNTFDSPQRNPQFNNNNNRNKRGGGTVTRLPTSQFGREDDLQRQQPTMAGIVLDRPNDSTSSSNSSNIQKEKMNQKLGNSSSFPQSESRPINNETQAFFAKIDHVSDLKRRMEEFHVQQLTSSSRKVQQNLADVLDEARKETHECRQFIDKYQADTKLQFQAKEINAAQVRMRENTSKYMYEQLLRVTQELWDAQKKHEKLMVEQTTRRVKVRFTAFGKNKTYPATQGSNGPYGSDTISDEEARRIAMRLVETGNEDQLFMLARDELEKVMRTRDAVIELERDMHELYQLFYDLSILVNEQHEQLGQIKHNVDMSHEKILQGQEQMKRAKYHGKRCGMCTVM